MLRRLLTYLGFTVLGFFLAWGAWFVQALGKDARPPHLRNLPSQTELIQAEFQLRLSKEFPEGTRQERLIAVLSQWGYEFALDERQQLWADLELKSFGCHESFIVKWQSTDEGTVSQVRGVHHLSCL